MKNWLKELFRIYVLGVFPWIIVFTASLFNSADSDLGWHLKYGEYFLKHHSILQTNIFSSEMIDFKWANHSWATDIVMYFTYTHFGFLGLSILGAIVVVGILYFFSKAANLNFWEKAILLPLIVYYEQPLFIVSFRSQLLSLLFLAILWFLIRRYEQQDFKKLYITIPLFFLWSNFHGEFILGLAAYVIWMFVYFGKNKFSQWRKRVKMYSDVKTPLLSLIGIIIATCINPFGLGIYEETIRHFGNPLLKFIIEWLPFEQYSQLWWHLIIWGVILLYSFLLIYKKKKILEYSPLIIITIFFYPLSFWMRRYTWPMFLLTIPLVRYTVSIIEPESKKVSTILSMIFLFIIYLYLIVLKNPSPLLRSMSWDFYCSEYIRCSPKSAEFLSTHKFPGTMLTFYNWGGWLIWNYPKIKPSIDGRMTLWRDEKGFSAFEEYYFYEQNLEEIDKSRFDIVYMSTEKPLYKHMLQLVNEGSWKSEYQDQYAAIFTRVKS